MSDLGDPPAIFAAWADYVNKDRLSGHQIDQQFVRRGFTGVGAEIDFRDRVYGAGTYDADIEVHSSVEAFSRYRVLESEIYEKLDIAEKSSFAKRDDMWEEVLHDPRLPSFLKSTALRSLNNERYEAMALPHVLVLRDALREEQETICKLYTGSVISLRETEMIELRKEVLNSTMWDAYSPLGFKVFKRKKNVNSYIKTLTEDYSIIIEPDVTAIQARHVATPSPSPLVYWPLMTFENRCYLGPVRKQDKGQDISLVAGKMCAASWRRSRYDDTRSLEVMIRADALWYELTLAPFEKSVIEFG